MMLLNGYGLHWGLVNTNVAYSDRITSHVITTTAWLVHTASRTNYNCEFASNDLRLHHHKIKKHCVPSYSARNKSVSHTSRTRIRRSSRWIIELQFKSKFIAETSTEAERSLVGAWRATSAIHIITPFSSVGSADSASVIWSCSSASDQSMKLLKPCVKPDQSLCVSF